MPSGQSAQYTVPHADGTILSPLHPIAASPEQVTVLNLGNPAAGGCWLWISLRLGLGAGTVRPYAILNLSSVGAVRPCVVLDLV